MGSVFGAFFSGFLASIIQLVIWLMLVKHYFDCGWFMALAISFIAVLIFGVVAFILGIIGFALIRFA